MQISMKSLMLGISLGSIAVLSAQTDATLTSVKKDLQASSKKLTEYRESVTSEKIELAEKLTSTKVELVEKRRKVKLAAMANADRKAIMTKLQYDVSAKTREVDFLESQIGGFQGKFLSSLYKGEILDPSLSPVDDSLNERMKLLEAGITRLERQLGGAVIEAEVANDEGQIQKGSIVSFGPVAWFSGEGDSSGAIVVDKASRNAKLVGGSVAEVSQLVSGDEVNLEMDLTGGKARALASISSTPLSLFQKGGAWIWPIIAVAFVSLICAIIKFLQLSKIKNPKSGWLSGLLENVREGDMESASETCNTVNHPVAGVMQNALTGAHKGADVVEEIIYEQMIDVQTRLQKWLPFIAVTAAIAPLLGLLGTVSGMITTFNGLSVVGTGDPKLLSGGISEALVTTLFGLVVAIPALVLHSLLSRRSQGIVQTTEKIGLTVVNCIRKK